MPEFGDERDMMYQNLMDAGCDDELTKRCLMMYEHNKEDELSKTLSMHRKFLLNRLHVLQHEIDCLDYLQLKLEKSK